MDVLDLLRRFHAEPPLILQPKDYVSDAQLPYSVKHFCGSLLILSVVLSMHSSFIFAEFWYVCGDVTEKGKGNHRSL